MSFDHTARARLLSATTLTAIFASSVIARAKTISIGMLFVTSSICAGNAGTVSIGQPLPNTNGAFAVANGTYPIVFNNDMPDPNFGITAPIMLSASFVVGIGHENPQIIGLATSIDLTTLTGVSTSFI